jgi:CheY-like chemotaxis protein
MQHILIVAEAKSFVLLSINQKLRNMSYKVTVVPAETDAINEVQQPIDAILIYADETLIWQQQSLNFLKDRAIMDDIPIFTTGDQRELNSINVMIPKHLILQEFMRPINVNDVGNAIDRAIKQYSAQVKKKILVVDDSGSALRSVKGWLEDKYSIFLANSGAMAIKYLTLNRPDLVLLDYEMPIVDGKQVLEMIRTEMDFADIPVMFLTNKDDSDTFLSLKDLKPDGYLLKSMEPAQIIKAVDDFFEKRKGLI